MAEDPNEKDIQDLIKRYSNQQQSFMGNNPPRQNPSQNFDGHSGIDNQGTINESTPVASSMMGPIKGPDPIPAGNICPQCEMVHPPIRPGEKCPNAIVKSMTKENTEVIVDVNKYLLSIRNILMSNIDKKQIKDINKLFQNITLEIAKFMEGYKE